MKNGYLKGLCVAGLASLTLFACKRNNEELAVSLTVQTLAGQYLLTGLTAETDFSPPINAMGHFSECELDNVYELKTDSSANYIDEGVKCEPAKNFSFKYEMTSKTVYLTGLQDKYFSGGTVKKFDGKTLVLEGKYKGEETNNIEVTLVGTLVKR